MNRRAAILLAVALIIVSGVIYVVRRVNEQPSVTAAQVITAFKAAGLEAESPTIAAVTLPYHPNCGCNTSQIVCG